MKFQGELRFLSNFWPAPVRMGGILFPTSEHAYQAMKSELDSVWTNVSLCATPGEAKRMGRAIRLRPNWEQIKDLIMLEIVRRKFCTNPELAKKLLATGEQLLIEGNNWHDNYWGSCQCAKCGNKGKNRLGEILMRVRKEIQAGSVDQNKMI
jgi:hypothetical protein